MELLHYDITTAKGNDPVYIHLFTDIHRAAPGCDAKKLRSDISMFKKLAEAGGHYWIGGGDWSNGIGPRDKRFDSSSVRPRFHENVGKDLHQAEARILAHEFEPIREWGIGLGMGNHEAAVAKYNEFNPATDIAERLNLPFLGYSAGIRLRLAAKNVQHTEIVTVFWHHGIGSARSKGAKVNALNKMKEIMVADVYLMGHDHELVDFPEVRVSIAKKGTLRLVKDDVLYVNGGTYLKAYPTDIVPQKAGEFSPDKHVHADYAEQKAYRPAVIGHNGFIIERKNTKKGLKPGSTSRWQRKLSRYDCRW